MSSHRKKTDVVLVYPQLGMSGSLVCHIPLSVLYAAVDTIEAGFEVGIEDVRLRPNEWQQRLSVLISPNTLLVGISVMSGTPIRNALEISRWVRKNHPHVKIVWGGPHALFNARQTMDESSIDFVISGYGSAPLAALAKHLRGDADAPAPESIKGLTFRDNGNLVSVPPAASFEITDYRQIPYHLVEADLHRYGQLDSGQRIFPMYSVLGCPYRCAFCSSPAQYAEMKIKYVPLPATTVADHIQMVVEKYGADYIYFIDDDSFVDLDHVDRIIDEIRKRDLTVGLGFRGARINEIAGMSDEYLTKLASAGTNIMHIGAESGSQRILDLMKKNCTVEDIIAVNRKMARHPEIKTAYNWVVGIPGETLDDLRLTCDLILRLIEENSSAVIFIPNKYRPLPGTELYQLAAQAGYRPPATLEDWVEVEAEGDFVPPWYTPQATQMIRLMQVASYFIDDKISKVATGASVKFTIVKFLAAIYAPIARFRMRKGMTAMLVEYRIFNAFSSWFRG